MIRVAVLDRHPAVRAGIDATLRTKPGMLCTAADPAGHAVAATLAGADAVVERTADLHVLLHAVRAVAVGDRALPRITPRLQAESAGRLAPTDRAIFAMRLADTAPADIGATVGLSAANVAARLETIVARLGASALEPAGGPEDPGGAPAFGRLTGAAA